MRYASWCLLLFFALVFFSACNSLSIAPEASVLMKPGVLLCDMPNPSNPLFPTPVVSACSSSWSFFIQRMSQTSVQYSIHRAMIPDFPSDSLAPWINHRKSVIIADVGPSERSVWEVSGILSPNRLAQLEHTLFPHVGITTVFQLINHWMHNDGRLVVTD